MRFLRLLKNGERFHPNRPSLIHQRRKRRPARSHHFFRQAFTIPFAHSTPFHIRRRRRLEALTHPVSELKFQLRDIRAERKLVALVVADPDLRDEFLRKFPFVEFCSRDYCPVPFGDMFCQGLGDCGFLWRTRPQFRETPRRIADGLAGFPEILRQPAHQQLRPFLQIPVNPPARQPFRQRGKLIHMHADRHAIVPLARCAVVVERIFLARMMEGVRKKFQPVQILTDDIAHAHH